MALVDAVALAAWLAVAPALDAALHGYERERRAHLAAYHRYSRWLTPLFQSGRDGMARLRDLAFLRAGRMPMARGHMLRVLSGTQHGWWRRHRLEDGFIAALDGALHASRMQ